MLIGSVGEDGHLKHRFINNDNNRQLFKMLFSMFLLSNIILLFRNSKHHSLLEHIHFIYINVRPPKVSIFPMERG